MSKHVGSPSSRQPRFDRLENRSLLTVPPWMGLPVVGELVSTSGRPAGYGFFELSRSSQPSPPDGFPSPPPSRPIDAGSTPTWILEARPWPFATRNLADATPSFLGSFAGAVHFVEIGVPLASGNLAEPNSWMALPPSGSPVSMRLAVASPLKAGELSLTPLGGVTATFQAPPDASHAWIFDPGFVTAQIESRDPAAGFAPSLGPRDFKPGGEPRFGGFLPPPPGGDMHAPGDFLIQQRADFLELGMPPARPAPDGPPPPPGMGFPPRPEREWVANAIVLPPTGSEPPNAFTAAATSGSPSGATTKEIASASFIAMAFPISLAQGVIQQVSIGIGQGYTAAVRGFASLIASTVATTHRAAREPGSSIEGNNLGTAEGLERTVTTEPPTRGSELLSWKSIEDAGSIEHALDLFLDHLAKVERSSDQSDGAGEETSWPLAWTVALVSVEVSRRWLGIGDTASGLRPRGKRSRIAHSKAPLAKLAGWPGSWSSRFP